jgi:hypothetical protein
MRVVQGSGEEKLGTGDWVQEFGDRGWEQEAGERGWGRRLSRWQELWISIIWNSSGAWNSLFYEPIFRHLCCCKHEATCREARLARFRALGLKPGMAETQPFLWKTEGPSGSWRSSLGALVSLGMCGSAMPSEDQA